MEYNVQSHFRVISIGYLPVKQGCTNNNRVMFNDSEPIRKLRQSCHDLGLPIGSLLIPVITKLSLCGEGAAPTRLFKALKDQASGNVGKKCDDRIHLCTE